MQQHKIKIDTLAKYTKNTTQQKQIHKQHKISTTCQQTDMHTIQIKHRKCIAKSKSELRYKINTKTHKYIQQTYRLLCMLSLFCIWFYFVCIYCVRILYLGGILFVDGLVIPNRYTITSHHMNRTMDQFFFKWAIFTTIKCEK